MTSVQIPLKRNRILDAVPNEDWSIILITLCLIAIVGALAPFIGGAPFQPTWYLTNLSIFALIGSAVLLAELSLRLVIARPDSPFGFVFSKETYRWFVKRLLASLPVAAVAIFMPAFSTMKSSIPLLNAFSWDDTFIAMDRAIHGTDPWRILQPIMGYPEITYAASTLYHWWFGLIYIGPFAFAYFVKDRALRMRFFLGYIGSWTVVGIVFATLLASVGPVFAQPILGVDNFAPQMEYLYSADAIYPIAVLDVQEQLLEWYRAGEYGLGRGITAMPSMHVALAWLYVLAMWPIDRRLGIAAAVFFAATLLSSVHLAYHYAVDGYVAIVLVTIVWWGVGRIAALLTPSSKEFG